MEFFRIIDVSVTPEQLQQQITPETLSEFTDTMALIEFNGENFRSHTIFGPFLLSYDKINGGVRFALLDCPNALTWTITTGFPPARDKVIIHGTINRTKKQLDFLEDFNELLDEWVIGIQQFY